MALLNKDILKLDISFYKLKLINITKYNKKCLNLLQKLPKNLLIFNFLNNHNNTPYKMYGHKVQKNYFLH